MPGRIGRNVRPFTTRLGAILGLSALVALPLCAAETGPTRFVECQQSALWMVEWAPTEPWPADPPGSDAPRIGIIDGAIDSSHPALARLLVGGADLVDLDGDPGLAPEVLADPVRLLVPGNLHATAMATLVAREQSVFLYAYRVLDEDCVGTDERVAAAIDLAVVDDVDVILLAVGVQQRSPRIAKALDRAARAGIAVITAAGNGGGTVTQPAKDKTTVAVGAVDTAGHPASFTASGPHVTLAATGVDVRTALPADYTARISGTSVAAAQVTAALGVVIAATPGWTNQQRIQLLLDTAAPLPATPSRRLGAGILDLPAALRSISADGTQP